MIEIDDLDGSREVLIGDVPDPNSSVADDDFGRGPFPASAPRFRINAVSEFVGGFNSAHIRGGIRVADGPSVLIHGSLREHSAELALTGAGSLSFDSAGPASGFGSHNRDLDAIDQHIHFRNALFGNNGQDKLFGPVDFLLLAEGYFRANALSRPFDGFGGDFQTRQYLHRLARWRERHLGTQHCFHASDAGRRFQPGNTHFTIRGMLSFGAMLTQVVGTPDLYRTD